MSSIHPPFPACVPGVMPGRQEQYAAGLGRGQAPDNAAPRMQSIRAGGFYGAPFPRWRSGRDSDTLGE